MMQTTNRLTPKEAFTNDLEKSIAEHLAKHPPSPALIAEIADRKHKVQTAKVSVAELNSTIAGLQAEVSTSQVEIKPSGFDSEALKAAALKDHERKLHLAALQGAVASAQGELLVRKSTLADHERRLDSLQTSIERQQAELEASFLAPLVYKQSWELALLIERLKKNGYAPYFGDVHLPVSVSAPNCAWEPNQVAKLEAPGLA